MKKLSVFIALALLAVSGTGYAVTCAQDYVPAASLLVPHFRVSRNGSQLNDIAACATCTNTLMAIVNVSTPGVIAHVTVWNKYSKAVLDFNVPLTGKDVALLDMRKILNGDLNNINVNFLVNTPVSTQKPDPCGLNLGNNIYAPSTGFGQGQFVRFSHPDASLPKSGNDAYQSISVYSPVAFSGTFRQKVWESLDESGDISEFYVSTGANILDVDNPACGKGGTIGDGTLTGDFSGYLTIDVVNYCTNFFPNQPDFYSKDAIATRGWCQQGPSAPNCWSPNVLFGDVFYIDPSSTASTSSGNVSGDPMVALEWDVRLEWALQEDPGPKTFYGRNVRKNFTNTSCEATGFPAGNCNTFVPPAYQFGGDGREPLGDRYGFRYYSDVNSGPLQTWAIVWREDLYRSATSPFTPQTEQDLCSWLVNGGKGGAGLYDDDHQVIAITYDNDENFNVPGGAGGPSGDTTTTNQLYIFLESQRLTLFANKQINPGYDQANNKYLGGWIDLTLRNSGAPTAAPPPLSSIYFNQAWVGVQHSGAGQAIGVGHVAALLYNDFVCIPWGYNNAQNHQVYPIGVPGIQIYP